MTKFDPYENLEH